MREVNDPQDQVQSEEEMMVVTEPVIMWGLDSSGWAIPITPTCLNGAHGDWALRKVGSQNVYSHQDTFEDEELWRSEREQTMGYGFAAT